MREYRFQATDATIEALRLLKAPWLEAALGARSFLVRTTESTIRMTVEREDVDSTLEAQRIRAEVVDAAPGRGMEAVDGVDTVPVAVNDLAVGRNDVVLFTGETWIERPPAGARRGGDGNGAAPPPVIQLSGRAGQRPPSAAVVCTTTDAIVVAAGTGEGILVRIGARPLALDVVQDRATIARFLVLRGYTAG